VRQFFKRLFLEQTTVVNYFLLNNALCTLMSEEQNFIHSEEMAITVPGKQKCPKYGQLCMYAVTVIHQHIVNFLSQSAGAVGPPEVGGG
jgi:hypothetical protein